METPVTQAEVVVIGAGPAGLAAAIQLAELGIQATVLDEKPEAGGQLFKQIHKFFGSERHMAGVRGFEIGRRLLGRCRELGVSIRLNTPVWGMWPDKSIAATYEDRLLISRPRAVIVATGASENSLSFPGCTLPGVMGAGAAQTLVNYYRVRPGDRALVVGAGNVGLIVAYQLLQAGIAVRGVVEVADQVGGYFVHAAKIRRMGVPLYTRHCVVRAEGDTAVESCTVAALDEAGGFAGPEMTFEADMICIAVGLSPAVELCRAVGLRMCYLAELGGYVPVHSSSLMTSIDGVFLAGDVSGIEEASSAMEEGRLAAVSAAEHLEAITPGQSASLKKEAAATLLALRSGPFGEMMAQRKREIYARFTEA